MRHTIRRITSGFTLVEVLIVVAIIGILATISIIGYSKIQAGARDTQRSTSITATAEALEKYYDQNGEYPSCAALTKSPSVVIATTLLGLDPTVLAAPRTTVGTNSFTCNSLTASSGDVFAYVGDGSSTCLTGTSCLQYTLQYREETTGNIISLQSRHSTQIATSGIAVLQAATLDFTQMNLTWTAVPNAASYTIQYSPAASFASGVVTQTNVVGLSTTVHGLTSGTKYYFRIAAVSPGSQGNWSNIASDTLWTLSAPTITSTSATAVNFTATWSTISHAITYTAQCSTDNSSWTGCNNQGLTATTFTFPNAIPGTLYYIRVQAVNGSFLSPWSSSVTAVTTIPAPTNVQVVSNSATQVTASWTAVPNAQTYKIEYAYTTNFSPLLGTASTTSPTIVFSSLGQGQLVSVRVYALIGTASSPASVPGSSVTPINQPAAPTYAGPASFTNRVYAIVNYQSYCPAGTSLYNGNFTSEFTSSGAYYGPHPFGYNDWWDLGSTTVNVYYWGRYQCQTANTTSPVSPDSFTTINVHF